MQQLHVRIGNPEQKFIVLMDKRKGSISNSNSQTAFVHRFW